MSALKEFRKRRKIAVKELNGLLSLVDEPSVRKTVEIFSSEEYGVVASKDSYAHLQEMMKTVGSWIGTSPKSEAVQEASKKTITAVHNAHALATFISNAAPEELINAGYDPLLPPDFRFAVGTK